jgi:DNA-binding response OmpR family regulator
MQNVLLAEPEPGTRGFLERHLRQDGFEVVPAEDGEALELLERSRPDVVLVSDALALELCERLREGEPGRSWDRDLPVIVLGGQEADAVDRVRAFARGADDFVVRPFHYEELVARIRAVLRRTQPSVGRVLTAGAIEVDTATRRVTVGGERVVLPGKEYELLVKLAGDPHRVLTQRH